MVMKTPENPGRLPLIGLSVDPAKLFNLEAGYSIHRFLSRVRIRQAETLLSKETA
jgi:hypothetical protein